MATLKTDYKDRTWSGDRKFNITENDDGTYGIEDVTEYENEDDAAFGAADINATNEKVNEIGDGNLNDFSFYQISDTQGGYSMDGGETIIPFRNPTGDAEESDVLAGVVFSSAELEDATGTMTDKRGTSTTATPSVSGSYLRMKIPTRGCYNTSSYLRSTFSTIAELIGLTAATIRSGYSILGISGTFTSGATATAARILNGYTAGVSGSMVTGTMTDKSGSTVSATASLDSDNSYLKMKIPTTGYYSTSSYLYATYSSIRTLIGLTAAKIRAGYSILGLSGTFTSDATATAARILNGYTAGINGSMVTGTMTNRGAVSVTLDPGESYTVTSGYHNGSGKVTANAATHKVVTVGSYSASRPGNSSTSFDCTGISGYSSLSVSNFGIRSLSQRMYIIAAYAVSAELGGCGFSMSYSASTGILTCSDLNTSYSQGGFTTVQSWISSFTVYCHYAV